jgi:hypothetical protein
MNEPEVKKRPGRSDCAKSLIADNDTLNDAKAGLNAKGSALSSCAPPAKKEGAGDASKDPNASSGQGWPKADSAKQDGFKAGPTKTDSDNSCRTSVFGCVQNSDGTYSTKIRESSGNQYQAPSGNVPTYPNGQVKLHNCPDGGTTCRSIGQ